MIALVIARFGAAERFARAVGEMRAEERTIVGLWSPMPVDLPGAQTDGGRPVVPAMAIAGIAGAVLFYALIWWSATRGYAFNSGNRPLHSWPAFLVSPLELGALAAAIAGMVAFGRMAGLGNLHDPAFDIDELEDAGLGDFVVAVRCESGAEANLLVATLADAGAIGSRVVTR